VGNGTHVARLLGNQRALGITILEQRELDINQILDPQRLLRHRAVDGGIGLLGLGQPSIGALGGQPEAGQFLLVPVGHVGNRGGRGRSCSGG